MISKGTAERGASFSECERFRYHLWRVWNAQLPRMVIIGLNPSTADEATDDRTISKCCQFAKREGCGGLSMVNLFAFRATKPPVMMNDPAPIGEENDAILSDLCDGGALIQVGRLVAAWGTDGSFLERDKAVWSWLKYRKPLCFGHTKDGHPKHPLYLPAKTPLVAYEGPR